MTLSSSPQICQRGTILHCLIEANLLDAFEFGSVRFGLSSTKLPNSLKVPVRKILYYWFVGVHRA